MRTRHIVSYGALAGAILIAGIAALVNGSGPEAPSGPPAIPPDPHKLPVEIVHAQRFDLQKPTPHRWRVGAPLYDSGWLLVLKVHPSTVFPRQIRQPVLYVGNQTAQRVNVGYESGHVVAIAPGDFFLTDAPIFFGHPELPERVSTDHIRREVSRARAAGVAPPVEDAVASVMVDALQLPDAAALEMVAVDLIERYSPQEKSLIEGMRVPLVK